jgi:hypothetical protein
VLRNKYQTVKWSSKCRLKCQQKLENSFCDGICLLSVNMVKSSIFQWVQHL